MKKLILGSLTVLSLALFSFTMPQSAPGIWQDSTTPGNFVIDPGATQAIMKPQDLTTCANLLQQAYSLPDQSTRTLDYVAFMKGKWILHTKAFLFFVDQDLVKLDEVTVPQQSAVAQMQAIVGTYAQPHP